MGNNKPIVILIIVLIAIASIAIGIVVVSYNENKPVNPDVSLVDALSSNDMGKIKAKYDTKDCKEEFIAVCESIELAVANKLLDGTVTNETELQNEILNINKMFLTNDWSKLGLEFPSFWMGTWSLDSTGAVKFSFANDEIKPNWIQDEDVNKYIK